MTTQVSLDQQVNDANLLLAYAITQGKAVGDSVIATIIRAKQIHAPGTSPSAEAWTEFSKAYRDLAGIMGDVTARTLQATSDEPGTKRWLIFSRVSEAKHWSQTLWLFTIGFAIAITFSENYQSILNTFFARDENTSEGALRWHMLNMVLQALVPFAFGGLGAATYLLRSAHMYFHSRTFDPSYIPEYFNRLLLGTIAGGTIDLLIDSVTQDGAVIDLSASALAFIAGYNADLLFRTIERLSEALLPKVGIESMRRAAAAPVASVSLPALFEQLDKAQTSEAREAIQGFIAKLRERV